MDGILYEDKAVIVCRKPAGFPTQTAKIGEPDMESALKNYLKSPYVGIIHRLDQPVEGILVFAKTKEASAKLHAQNAGQAMGKTYYAVVLPEEGKLWTEAAIAKPQSRITDEAADGREYCLTDYLLKNGKENKSAVVDKETPQAKRAELSYRILRRLDASVMGDGAAGGKHIFLLEVTLKTGRHHQIRVQLSHAGLPLLGDGKYGSPASRAFAESCQIRDVALCACRLEFLHPVSGKRMVFTLEPSGAAFRPFF